MKKSGIGKLFKNATSGQLMLYLGIGVIALLIILFFFKFLLAAIVIIAVALVAVFTRITGLKNFGIELATMGTVLFGMAYGPGVGLFMGLLFIIIQMAIGQFSGSYLLWVIPSYAVAGFIAGLFGESSVAIVGISLIIGMNAIFLLFTAMLSPGAMGHFLPHAGLNVVINILLFKSIAPALLQGMS